MKKQLQMAIIAVAAMIGGVSAQNMDSREGDSLALVDIFRFCPNGTSYTDALRSAGLNASEFATLDSSGRVVTLDLRGVPLYDKWGSGFTYFGIKLTALPATIANLKCLKELIADGNKLSFLPPEIENLTNLTSISIDNNLLTEIPTNIGNLKNLTSISIDNNLLTEIPTNIGNLENLTSIRFENNLLTEIPTNIGNLKNLTSCNFGRNKLSHIPREVGNLTKLTWLWLGNNLLEEIPVEIFQLVNLRELSLGNNQLVAIDPKIGNLKTLEFLNLSGNKLPSIPFAIGNLTELTTFNLSGNQLSTLPSEIGMLTNLYSLDVSSNRIITLPKEIGTLLKIKVLNLANNRLSTLPIEITNLSPSEMTMWSEQVYYTLHTEGNLLTTNLPDTLKLWLNAYDMGWDKTQDVPISIVGTSRGGGVVLSAKLSGTALQFSTDLPSGTSVNLYDFSGRQIFTGSVTGRSVNVGSLATGMYITRIGSGTAVRSMKLIVQ